MNRPLIVCLTLAVLAACPVTASASVWASAPRPKFPEAALRKGSEGYVIVRAYVGPDGRVTRTAIAKNSGDSALDEAARVALLKWKMNPSAFRPQYSTQGFEQRIDFKQEAPIAARYRDRAAFFSTFDGPKMWIYAPFPEYPYRERMMKSEGITLVRLQIGPTGQVASAEVARSSGFPNLDKAAVAAVQKWRARKQYAGVRAVMPVTFTLRSLRR